MEELELVHITLPEEAEDADEHLPWRCQLD